ncbi:hypothetical protein L596_008810 [Steinernema carpocapsae]|uniref:7TM GPCR serpentine receptor class x (Srx) domain-containing protein n=1 Tax=Steinernema carpocapsae TaxID=34508 RepID=A0A4U5PDK0_STECR|nr:hypothetical protein L596_008810 [Steinernema carpocapsae]
MDVENVLVGSAMIVASSICILLNGLVLTTIVSSADFYVHSSYKLMFLMGVFDVAQLIVHTVTGVFTVLQFEAGHTAYTILGAIQSSSYECYVLVTVLLAFNRFALLCCRRAEHLFFSPKADKLWILATFVVFFAFFGVHSTNNIFTSYSVEFFQWTYDYAFPWSRAWQMTLMWYQISGVLVAWGFYIAIFVRLLRYVSL